MAIQKDFSGRKIWMDLLKILSAYMVVIIHISSNIYKTNYDIGGMDFFKGLYINSFTRFAVPCFFMISGVLMLSKERTYSYSINKIPKLVGAWLFWSIIYLLGRKYIWHEEVNLLKEMAIIPFLTQSGHMWYIYQLIWIYLFLPFISILYEKTDRNQKRAFLTVTLLGPSILDFICRMCTDLETGFVDSFSIKLQPPYIGLVFLGRYLYDSFKDKREKRWRIFFGSIVYIGIAALIISSWYLSEKRGYASDELFGELQLPTLIYGIGVFLLFMSFSDIIDNIGTVKKKIIKTISDSLLEVYLGHCILQWIMGTSNTSEVKEIILLGGFQFIVCVVVSCCYHKMKNYLQLKMQAKR